MRLPLSLALLCLASPAVLRAGPPLLSPATAIPDPAHNPAWNGLFSGLAPRETRESFFEERRTFPFRRNPVVLTGEIRIAPGRGLSLHYLTPESRVLIVDGRGLLMRDDLGRDLPAPADARAQAAITALVDILRFDVAELQRNFDVHGIRDGAAWTLAFVPRDKALAENLTALIVSGDHDNVSAIELFTSPRQHIDIIVHGARKNVAFTAGEWARYFR